MVTNRFRLIHCEGGDTQEIASNAKLSENYLALARDLDVMEAKTPEDIYKSHLVEGRAPSGAAQDSARQNLATTFVNAFVNAGYVYPRASHTTAWPSQV
jgi:26S proteasome regulatory subunit N1